MTKRSYFKNKCCRCEALCDGSLMRHNSKIIEDLLLDECVPRTVFREGIALCHHCQRSVYFAGSFLKLLINDLKYSIDKIIVQCP